MLSGAKYLIPCLPVLSSHGNHWWTNHQCHPADELEVSYSGGGVNGEEFFRNVADHARP